ncbi:uncharacterized protein LOC111636338 isoform X2 [Centruroides sculpturatus]|uniref:uncharacterized protein LOC111636338 isoform X2 n=1 Tax=Centruroides sculpturatus TaxID=218467 RepID=UPI000C6CCE52|nr:uncharacterized protein LOC111636338 isoform X2 [Centruroides sculpturatus]
MEHNNNKGYSYLDGFVDNMQFEFCNRVAEINNEIGRIQGQVVYRERELNLTSPICTNHNITSQNQDSNAEIKSNFIDTDTINKKIILLENNSNGIYLNLRLDISQYDPKGILINPINNQIKVHAKYNDKIHNRMNEYLWEYHIPEGVYLHRFDYFFTKNGILTIDGIFSDPISLPIEHFIQIERY